MKILRNTLFLILLILICFQSNISIAQRSFDTQNLDTYLSTLEQYDKFMGSVAVLEDDNVLFQKAYGFVNEDKQPANSETVYRIGSITKTYTATIVMKLVEEGKIELSDKLSEFFPGIPKAKQITIEQLLRHRSGLVNITGVPEYQEYYTKETTREEMLDRIGEYGVTFEPGEKFEYSNTGYVLLGYIIENITGMSYAEALTKYITKPLGLDRTYYGQEISIKRGEAHSFYYGTDSWELNSQTHLSVPHGAGAIVSTPTEMAQFLRDLFDSELISNESLKKIKNLKDGYGLGITTIPFYDKMALGHSAGIDGFHSTAGHFPDDDITFVIIGNGINYPMNDIVKGVLGITFGKDFEIPDFSNEPGLVDLSEEELKAYTGVYSSEDIPLEMEVFLEKGILKAQASGQGSFPLTAYEGGVMRYNPFQITMEFEDKGNGRFQAFELKQGNQTYSFIRKVK